MTDPRRFFRYTLAFAGLLSALYAVTGLLGLGITTLALRPGLLSGAEDARVRASLYLAALIVGAPIWLGFWSARQSRAARSVDERRSFERRLFLGAVFALASVVALYELHAVLRYLLTLPGTGVGEQSAQHAAYSAARLLTYGAAWLYHARISWSERAARDEDELHDVAVYVLAAFSLAFLANGLVEAIGAILRDLLAGARPTLVAEPTRTVWDRWGGIAARLLSGAPVWAAVWRYELGRGGRRHVRAVYLYLVLLAAAPTALGSAAQGLYETLRRVFGYREEGLGFLADFLPLLVVAGGVWAYHWTVVRGQAALGDVEAVAPPQTGGEVGSYNDGAPNGGAARGGIAWPRRLGYALLTALGIVVLAPAVVSVLWLGLDFALNTGGSLSGGAWWRDRLSVSLAAGLVGFGAWVGGWRPLQRAAAEAPMRERTAEERRRLLGVVVLVSALTAIGFTVALLWLVLQTLLGAGLDGGDVSRMLRYLAASAVALAILAYHGLLLRRDLAFGPARTAAVRVVALVAPGGEEALGRLRKRTGRRIEVLGHLGDGINGFASDLPRLEQQLAELDGKDHGAGDSALLLIGPDGGSVHPYRRRKP